MAPKMFRLGGLKARRGLLATASAVIALSAQAAVAAEEVGAPVLVNDFGGVGLIQTPTARTGRDGDFFAGSSLVWPYLRYYLTFQPFPWLEGTFRYTDIRNRLYSPFPTFSGNQSFKDRGVDLKIRLVQESLNLPQIAIGARDIGGTGLFASEYVVANKRFGDIDLSFGMGWGNLSTRNHVSNPFRIFGSRFDQRQAFTPGGGTVELDFFTGRQAAFFGGISYKMPIDGLTLKAEYDPNSYQFEPLGNRFDVDSPVNVAVEYQPFDWLHTAVGLERGNRAMFRLTATTNFHERSRVPKIDPPAPLMQPRPAAILPAPGRLLVAEPSGTVPGAVASRIDAVQIRSIAGPVAAQHGYFVHDASVDGSRAWIGLAGEPLKDEVAAAIAIGRHLLSQSSGTLDIVDVATQSGGHERFRITVRPDPALPDQMAESPASGEAEIGVPVGQTGISDELWEKLTKDLRQQGIFAFAGDFSAPKAQIFMSQNRYRETARGIGRAVRVAANLLPPEYEELSLVLIERGMEVAEVSLLRSDLEGALTLDGRGSVEEIWSHTRIMPPPLTLRDAPVRNDVYPTFSWTLRPGFRQSIGRPEAFFLYQVWARAGAAVQFGRGLSLSGSVGVDIYNNFDKMRVPSDSVLPHVRSDIAAYLREGDTALINLQGEYAFNVTPELFGRVYGGLLEEMFGGVGGELMYRPINANWAIGADLNWVKQRDYDQRFDFRDYDVVTGHVSGFYYYEPLDVNIGVRAGRYLAGDVGATFELSRTFDSGITIGAFATFTDVPPEEFGEGRFDKGFYITVPLDQLLVRSVRGSLSWLYRPLTRDGGQILATRGSLLGAAWAGGETYIRQDWERLLD
ncbi:YjbH domain-containing protein [Indioceanicola profundi]|uniref:YjbH domain-containing protein n=1 Tax=Indioceanicola profundi TaxID=2220096 RepID=UPI000E6ACF73|nr:YjbH domain-containing protein [Indioceanicola profundi]